SPLSFPTRRSSDLGATALALLDDNEFDLVFLDIELDDANGLDLAEIFRARLPRSILSMSTAVHTHEAMLRACKMGVNLYVIKPFNIMNLVNFVKNLDASSLLNATNMTVLDN